ncbi:MAG TPA: peptidylprolyl isomerase [Candidatus Limnocylindria bacterium]|jgi:parvulin-like peptidyl-prolyl isomerase
MSFRNRPVLDRKHRPRWQDELRSQQLTVAGFALAIAVAIGIFGAATWNAYYDASLRQVALVEGKPVTQAQLSHRMDTIYAELGAALADLQGQLGGAGDPILEQQIQAVNDTASQVASIAFDSLLTGAVLDASTTQYPVTVPEADIDAEVEKRLTLPERLKLSLIMVLARPAEDAAAGSEPTEDDWAAAEEEANQILAEIEGGASFATLAAERSDHASNQFDGLLGWVEATDAQFGDFFEAAGDTAAGEVVGPLRNDQGWYLLRVDERKPAGPNELLDDLLGQASVTDAEFRAYLRDELLRTAFGEYFATSVVERYQPQREVAQIQIVNDQGVPIPRSLIRHLLVQPIPGGESQAEATDEQWAAALAKAEALRVEAIKPDADWFELAKQSDDPGSRDRGGSLGWYDPATSGFVQEFKDAVGQLRRNGDTSEPVRTEFGYHVIQLVDRRVTAGELAERLAADLREDPGSFADVALVYSEDATTAQQGGELGWVVHYQFEAIRDTAIFDLTEPDQISDPVVSGNNIYIYKLLDSSPSRFVPQSQREQIGESGFSRWLEELKDRAGIWTDPELAPASAVG